MRQTQNNIDMNEFIELTRVSKLGSDIVLVAVSEISVILKDKKSEGTLIYLKGDDENPMTVNESLGDIMEWITIVNR